MSIAFFIPAVSLYALLLYSKLSKSFFFPEIINNYLSDLLCIPLVLTSCLWIIRWLKNDRSIRFTLPMILVVVVLFSVVFEWVLPSGNDMHTADLLDVCCYGIGGGVYYWKARIELMNC